MENNQKEIQREITRDGSSTTPSRSLVVLNVQPPRWNSWRKDPDAPATIGNFSFYNSFVYNFYTQEEREKYNYNNPDFDFSFLRTIDGKQVQEALKGASRITSGHVPSYVKLSWDISHVFSETNVGSFNQIKDFKIISGESDFSEDDIRRFNSADFQVPIRGGKSSRGAVSFELHQKDFIDITNEYLDMFSDMDFSSETISNPWFAEEIDGSNFASRFQFLRNNLISNLGYKNFTRQIKDDGASMMNPMEDTSLFAVDTQNESVPTVIDSSLLENLEYPETFETPDITLVLNSQFAADISRSSVGNAGKILGTQSRIRNLMHIREYNRTLEEGIENSSITPLEKILTQYSFYKESPYLNNSILPSAGNITEFRLVGFVIEKTETFRELFDSPEEGIQALDRKYPLIFVPCSRNRDESGPVIPTEYLDAAVNYGSEYRYSIRAVFTFNLSFRRSSDEQFITRSYLITTSYSDSLQISCLETTPPPPPRDTSAFFDFTKANRNSQGKINLTWSFPVNKQRDTTGFAVFRRNSIYEPFNLIKILDFNFSIKNKVARANNYKIVLKRYHPNYRNQNSGQVESGGLKYDSTERIVSLLTNQDSFTNYIDHTFKPDIDYIYAICSIDAHGQISNYGEQIMVNFNSRVSRLSLEQISSPGAPLVFPNWFIKSRAFQDVARVSKYRRAVLKFRPDYRSITVGEGESTFVKNVVKGISQEFGGNPNNAYYMQIINVDRGEDIVLKYVVNDIFAENFENRDIENVAEMMGVSIEDLL